MAERIERRTMGGRSSNTCAFCAYHGKALTPRQMRQHDCLRKGCTALIRHEHPIWEYRDRAKQYRKERKERMERLYLKATGGGSHAVHTETASAEGS